MRCLSFGVGVFLLYDVVRVREGEGESGVFFFTHTRPIHTHSLTITLAHTQQPLFCFRTSVGLSLRNYIAPGVVHMAEELEMVRTHLLASECVCLFVCLSLSSRCLVYVCITQISQPTHALTHHHHSLTHFTPSLTQHISHGLTHPYSLTQHTNHGPTTITHSLPSLPHSLT